MRCLSLMDAMRVTGRDCAFAICPGSEETVPALGRSGVTLRFLDHGTVDESGHLREIWPAGVDTLVIDHYSRGAEFEAACRGWAKQIIVIDDLANRLHDCDLIVDQTAGRTSSDYEDLVPSHARMCLGPAFALLRPQFPTARPNALSRRRAVKCIDRVLISFGAVDKVGATETALSAVMHALPHAEVDVVLGARSPNLTAVRQTVQRFGSQMQLHCDTDAMASLVAKADLAIGAPGSSSWERCALGLPTLLVIVADNQLCNAEALEQTGAAIALGQFEALEPVDIANRISHLSGDIALLHKMSQRGAELCDGRGASRLLTAMLPGRFTDQGASVTLRLAEYSDCGTLLDWQRDPRTRRMFRNPDIPDEAEHAAWFERSMADPSRWLFMMEADGEPVGSLRLDERGDGTVEVSIYTSPQSYRRGFATAALQLARELMPARTFVAEVADGNDASTALFTRSNFRPVGGVYMQVPEEGMGRA